MIAFSTLGLGPVLPPSSSSSSSFPTFSSPLAPTPFVFRSEDQRCLSPSPFAPTYFALARVKDTLRRNLREREKEAEIGIKRGGRGGSDAASDPSSRASCCIGDVNAFFGFLSSPKIAQCLFCRKETREKWLGQIGLQLLLRLNPSPKKGKTLNPLAPHKKRNKNESSPSLPPHLCSLE